MRLLKKTKMVFRTDYRLMLVKSIAECTKGSILQYFRPSLSYHLSLKSLFCLFFSGCLRQVLLYLCSLAGWIEHYPVANPEDKFLLKNGQLCLTIFLHSSEWFGPREDITKFLYSFTAFFLVDFPLILLLS